MGVNEEKEIFEEEYRDTIATVEQSPFMSLGKEFGFTQRNLKEDSIIIVNGCLTSCYLLFLDCHG